MAPSVNSDKVTKFSTMPPYKHKHHIKLVWKHHVNSSVYESVSVSKMGNPSGHGSVAFLQITRVVFKISAHALMHVLWEQFQDVVFRITPSRCFPSWWIFWIRLSLHSKNNNELAIPGTTIWVWGQHSTKYTVCRKNWHAPSCFPRQARA